MRGRDLRHSVSPEPADFFVDPRRYVIRGAVTQDDEALRRVVAFYNADRVRPPEGIITTVIEAVQQRGVTPRWPVVLFPSKQAAAPSPPRCSRFANTPTIISQVFCSSELAIWGQMNERQGTRRS